MILVSSQSALSLFFFECYFIHFVQADDSNHNWKTITCHFLIGFALHPCYFEILIAICFSSIVNHSIFQPPIFTCTLSPKINIRTILRRLPYALLTSISILHFHKNEMSVLTIPTQPHASWSISHWFNCLVCIPCRLATPSFDFNGNLLHQYIFRQHCCGMWAIVQ